MAACAAASGRAEVMRGRGLLGQAQVQLIEQYLVRRFGLV